MATNSICPDIANSDVDLFDRLPDDIVLSIFFKLHDAKSLCLSMSVSKRFRSIAPQVDQVFLPVPKRKFKEFDQETAHRSSKNVVIRALMKPFHFISQMIKSKSKSDDNSDNDLDFYNYYIPNEILNSFETIRVLHLRLPCHVTQNHRSKNNKSQKPTTTFLKWKAVFGRELHSCVILGAKSWAPKKVNENIPQEPSSDQLESSQSRFMADEDLKVRIVWTISCLIAASARHYLIRETVKGQKSIESVEVSDESDQGRLCMDREQIEEMRGNDESSGLMMEYRSRVPALRMKMWYLERLEMADSGRVMEGATLVVIRPAAGGGEEGRSDGDMVAGAFGEEGEGKVLDEAVRKLMVAKKCYTLEMNSF